MTDPAHTERAPDTATSAGHEEQTVQQLAEVYQQHDKAAGTTQKLADRLTAQLGRPRALVVVLAIMITWMAANAVAAFFGLHPTDVFPFPKLEFVATIGALLVALLILTTQRHEDDLAGKRAHLTLQIALLSEKKIAKMIALVEEQRRDNPLLQSRSDPEAAAMADASDPRTSTALSEDTPGA